MSTAEIIAGAAAIIALLSSAAAWASIIANRWNTQDSINAETNNAARSSRATVVSANRQRWIDAVREDVADFIGTRSQIAILKYAGSMENSGRDALLTEERILRTKVVILYSRIEMRLNHNEEDSIQLLNALRQFDQDASTESEAQVREIGRKIFSAEWARLKKEASGIDPFVKEAIPPRRT